MTPHRKNFQNYPPTVQTDPCPSLQFQHLVFIATIINMAFFHTYNMTLWNIVMAINRAENGACSLQVARAYNRINSTAWYNQKSLLLEAATDMMILQGIPVVMVDYSGDLTNDQDLYRVKTQRYGGTSLVLRYVELQ